MNLTIPYVKIQCECGFIFAVPRSWDERRRKDHNLFSCPACGIKRYYPGGLEEAEDEILEQAIEKADYFKRRAAAYKGCFAKLKKQIEKGVDNESF